MVLPKQECTRVMELEGTQPLAKVKDEVNVLYEHCDAGKALFSSAVKGLSAQMVVDKIMDGIKALEGGGPLEEKSLSSTLQRLHDDISKIAGVDTLQGKRPVTMAYRGLKISVMCSDTRDQATQSLRLAVREKASVSGVLQSLPGESFLPESSTATFAVAASACSKAKTARAQLARLLEVEAEASLSGDTVLVLWGWVGSSVVVRNSVMPGLCRHTTSPKKNRIPDIWRK